MEKLAESGEAAGARNRHLDYFLDYAYLAESWTFSPQSLERLDQLEIEHDNLRAALEWATENQPAKALKLAELLSGFKSTRDYQMESRYWCQRILSRTEGISALENARARVFQTLGWIAFRQGDQQAGRDASEAALFLAKKHNDSKTVARSLNGLAISSLYLGYYLAASKAAEESEAIAREMGYSAELALALVDRAQIAFMLNRDLVAAKRYFEESVSLGQAADLQYALGFSIHGLAVIAGASGDIETARRRFEESANLGQKMGNRQMINASRSDLTHILREHGELDEPLAIYKEVVLGWKEFGHRAAVAHELECMAYIFWRLGQALRTANLLGAAEALRQAIDSSMTGMERDEYEREVSALRAQLDVSTFTKAWAQGRAMTMDEAIALAIDDHA